MTKEFSVTRISKNDLEWLKERAARNFRTPPLEISAIRELVERLGVDILPHPSDGEHIPVITRITSKGGQP